MFFLPVALLTTAAAALLNLWLGIRVSQLRLSENILVGDGGNPRLIARMRAQLNFAEYTPFVLILVALIELALGTRPWLWAVATLYIVGRVLHAFGMDGWRIGRMLGIAITMLVLLGLGLIAAWLGYQGLDPLR